MKTKVFDVQEIRAQFPALRTKDKDQTAPIFFDGPGGTQMNHNCVHRMLEYIETGMANLHGSFSTSKKTDCLLEEAREAVAELLNCNAEEVAFGQNMTSLAFQISNSLKDLILEGDQIVVTQLDHRANVDPWLHLARQRKAEVRFIPVDRHNFTLDLSNIDAIINERTKLVAVGLSSNLTGTINEAKTIFSLARKFNAITIADAVHAVPHFAVDLQDLQCDVLLCSAYKFFGPHLGIAAIKKSLFCQLAIQKLLPAPEQIPDKLETGTQNHEAIAGLCGAISFIESLGTGSSRRKKIESGMRAIERHEHILMKEMEAFLASIPEVTLFRATDKVAKTPTFAFKINGVNSRTATIFFAEKFNLCIGDGHFYASTMAEIYPVMASGGWIRIGFAPYNTLEELEVFKTALKELLHKKL